MGNITARASAARRLLAAASLGAAAAGFLTLAAWDKAVLGFAALVGAGAIALGRRSLLAQVLGRGVAWLVLTPSLVGIADALWHGHPPDARTALFSASSSAALLLARPALHTAEARAEFAPIHFRRLFLAGAVASAMTGTAAALFAAEALRWGMAGMGLGLGAIGAALLFSAIGVVRMRTWGVLLAGLTSVATLAAAMLSSGASLAFALSLASIPGPLLAAPLLLARLESGRRRGAAPVASGSAGLGDVGVSVDGVEDAPPPVRVRVGPVAAADADDLGDPAEVAIGRR
jgi:hypothetical protein